MHVTDVLSVGARMTKCVEVMLAGFGAVPAPGLALKEAAVASAAAGAEARSYRGNGRDGRKAAA